MAMSVVVVNHVSLDGVMQGPARPDEDERGGFSRGGWGVAGGDEVMGRVLGERMARAGGALLLGRRTYVDFSRVWPARPESPYAQRLEQSPKYVVSSSLREPLPWANSYVVSGALRDAVREIEARHGAMTVLGSGELIGGLMAQDLVDEWLLLIHPLVLGSGRRLFAGGVPARLALADSVVTGTGVVIATYRRA
jgi:dihydrofolate reductase